MEIACYKKIVLVLNSFQDSKNEYQALLVRCHRAGSESHLELEKLTRSIIAQGQQCWRLILEDWKFYAKRHCSGATSRKYRLLTWRILIRNCATKFHSPKSHIMQHLGGKNFRYHTTSTFSMETEAFIFTKKMNPSDFEKNVSFKYKEKYIWFYVKCLLCIHKNCHRAYVRYRERTHN